MSGPRVPGGLVHELPGDLRKFGVTEYERHRNKLIEETQGNRNPFIDEPATARQVAFNLGLS